MERHITIHSPTRRQKIKALSHTRDTQVGMIRSVQHSAILSHLHQCDIQYIQINNAGCDSYRKCLSRPGNSKYKLKHYLKNFRCGDSSELLRKTK